MRAVLQVSDAILDACLEQDPDSKVACETASKTNMVGWQVVEPPALYTQPALPCPAHIQPVACPAPRCTAVAGTH